MIQENAEIAEAERLGIVVSDAEVRAQILAIPGAAGERPVHRRAAVPAGAASAGSTDDAGGFRADRSTEPDAGQIPRGLTEWMSISDAELEREYKPPQRKGDPRCRRRPRGELQEPGESQRRGDRRALQGEHGDNTASPSSARSGSSDSTPRTRGEDQRAPRGRRAILQRAPRHRTRRPSRSARATSC